MQLPPSKRNVQPPERPQVAPVWLVLLMAGLVGGALWALYPRDDLQARLQAPSSDVQLSEAYLRNLLRNDPDNAELKAMLDRLIQAQGTSVTASVGSALITPETPSSWSVWESSYVSFQNAPHEPKEVKEQARLNALQKQGEIPVEQLNEAQLVYAGQAALALQDIEVAERFFQAASQLPNANLTALWDLAAKAAWGNAMYDTASAWYLKASEHEVQAAAKKEYALSAVAVLQAGNMTEEALALAEKVWTPYKAEPSVLRKLVELARAAGQTATAEKYAKQLLKLSLLQQAQSAQFAQNDAESTPSINGNAQRFFWDHELPAPSIHRLHVSDKSGPALPFDDKTYELGFFVFLENRNMEDAWRVARAAVQQAPGNLVWRRRLAEVSEWTQRPLESLHQWHQIAKTTNDGDAWKHVLRLAPGLLDDEALVDGLRYQLRSRPADLKLIREIVATYERLGQPDKAIALLENSAPSTDAGEALADLYERTGQDRKALLQWEKVFQNPQSVTAERASKAAVLALRLGEGKKSLQWLRSASQASAMDAEDTAHFLRLQAEVAEHEDSHPEALEAYMALITSEEVNPEDFDSLIELLRRENQIREATVIAKMAWDKYHSPKYFVEAMTYLAALQDWKGATPLVLSLQQEATPETRAQLRNDPTFYPLLGNYYQGLQQSAQAAVVFAEGLRRHPDSSELRQASLWSAIESNNAQALKLMLQANEQVWQQDVEMHDSLSAAYQALSLPQVAIDRYLRPRLNSHQHDFLWMMGYADALEQNQQRDEAWLIRKALLEQQRNTPHLPRSAGEMHAWLRTEAGQASVRLARARLVMAQNNGDQGMAALREILRMDLDENTEKKQFSQAATDLLIGWYQEAGEYTAVRGYLWERYARIRSKNLPLWAEISSTLAADDQREAGHLLEKHGDSISRYDRITAAAQLGDIRRAQTDAFDAQTYQHADDSLHQQLTENLLAFSDNFSLQHSARSLNELSEHHTQAGFHWALTPRWSADISATKTQRSSRDTSLLQNPSDERGIDLGLNWKDQRNTVTAKIGQRESLDTYHPKELNWEHRFDRRLRLRAEWGHELSTQETTALRLGGMKNRWGVGVSYQPTRLDTISLDYAHDKYRLQTGASIGSSKSTSLQYMHSLRTETPSLEVGAFWSTYQYSENKLSGLGNDDLKVLRYAPNPRPSSIPAGFLLPKNFRYSGLTISTNQRYSQDYTRGLQPFASLSLTHHSRDGAGYGGTLGLAGSVLGNDHLMLGINLSKSSPQAKGTTRELTLGYRLHF